MQELKIEYVPYVGLINGEKFVKTKMKSDGKLYFFEVNGNEIVYDEFIKASIDELEKNKNIKVLGYVNLLKD